MRVVIFDPGKPGRVADVANELKALQEVVGGYIEAVGFATDAVIICNEEGRLLGLPENRLRICGTFLVCGVEGDEFADLPENTASRLAKII